MLNVIRKEDFCKWKIKSSSQGNWKIYKYNRIQLLKITKKKNQSSLVCLVMFQNFRININRWSLVIRRNKTSKQENNWKWNLKNFTRKEKRLIYRIQDDVILQPFLQRKKKRFVLTKRSHFSFLFINCNLCYFLLDTMNVLNCWTIQLANKTHRADI